VVIQRHHRRFVLALLVSIVAHIAVFTLPKMKTPELVMAGSTPAQTMNVVLDARPESVPPEKLEAPVPAQPTPSQPPPPRLPMPPIVTPRIVRKSPNAIEPEPPPTPRPPQPRPPPIPELDMAAMIEARRAQRRAASEAAAPPSQAEPTQDQLAQARIARNLHMDRGEGVGGVFEILRKGTRTAEFAFNGWRPDTERRWREVIEVDAGTGGDVERAIVRRMIELIRTHYTGDFRWESHHLGRVVVLSARSEDQSGLEDFMMREFFGAPPPPSAYRR
jgi:outer membrane biosynthesis protein TonB